jgi:hypothetical protein
MVAADVNMDTRSAPILFDYLQAFQVQWALHKT